jgi:hypothetical protein
MNIFISWSGDRSLKVAQFLEEWLKSIIQSVNPWISTKHIDNGSLWFSEIATNLSTCNTGIICLTPENKDKPWVLFEAGCLSKGLRENRIYTLLIDLSPVDIKDPLSQFNHTLTTRDSIYKLLCDINQGLENPLGDKILQKSFDLNWPEFENEVGKIISNKPANLPSKATDTEMIEEILLNTRSLQQRTSLDHNTPILFDENVTKYIGTIHPDFIKMEIDSWRKQNFDDSFIYMKLRQQGYPQPLLIELMRQYNARYPREKE